MSSIKFRKSLTKFKITIALPMEFGNKGFITADIPFAILFMTPDRNPYLHQWTCPNPNMEESTSEIHE